jgi:hypothetical protein
MDQASIGEIDIAILIFSKHALNLRRGSGELERNLKSTSYYILENRFRRAPHRP